ncbi:cell adhesion molecule 4 isoform X2 [Oryzias melastigma]|nr:cell adhesion molecule 4 isoform X2 [Oryzias melastigma]XP_036071929.1 cell adhesion molecule 4 isoform X2 [Oryzias melastigma]
MTDQTTPRALVQTSTEIVRTFPDLVTKIGEKDIYAQTEDFAALIGGIISGILLTFICTIAVLLWCLSRQKGSYATNETDEDEDEDDNRSVDSDSELQSKKPLKDEEED